MSSSTHSVSDAPAISSDVVTFPRKRAFSRPSRLGACAKIPAFRHATDDSAPIAVVTMGYALFQTANNSAVMGALPPAKLGSGGGLLATSRNVGMVLGVATGGALFEAGKAEISKAGEKTLRQVAEGLKGTGNVEAAKAVGKAIAEVRQGLRKAERQIEADARARTGSRVTWVYQLDRPSPIDALRGAAHADGDAVCIARHADAAPGPEPKHATARSSRR